MKKVALIVMVLVFAFMLTMVIGAEEVTVTTAADFENEIKSFNANGGEKTISIGGDLQGFGSSGGVSTAVINGKGTLTINLTDDVLLSEELRITGETKVILNLNSHTLKVTSGQIGGNGGSAIFIDNSKAYFEASNGTITIRDVAIWLNNGTLNLTNVNAIGHQEGICAEDNSAYRNMTVKGGSFTGIDMEDLIGENLFEDCKIVKHLNEKEWTVSNNVPVCEIDCYEANTITLRNVTTDCGATMYFLSGRQYGTINLYDSNLVFVHKTHGNASVPYKATYYTTPTCTREGTYTVYEFNKEDIVNQKYADMLPHSISQVTSIEYDSYFEKGFCVGSCGMCQEIVRESEATTSPLFIWKGYSVNEAGKGITMSYGADFTAISDYETVTGKKVSYGFLVATGDNFANDQYVMEELFARDYLVVEVVLNYGDLQNVDDIDVVMACVVSVDGEKSYCQATTDKTTSNYTSSVYGILYGASYSDLK